MISVAVVGASGYVGGALCAALTRRPGHAVTRVTRATCDELRSQSYDILINAAMPSGRFRAKNYPAQDFVETVAKTADLVYGWRFRKFVQISTLSARCQRDTVYGRHKAAAEMIGGVGESLVVRLGPMYSEGLRKGVLIDLLEGRTVFVDGSSRYGFAPLEFVADWVARNLHRAGIKEVGAKNAIELRDLATHLRVPGEFQGAVDHQEIQDPEEGYPDARDVLAFLDTVRLSKRC